MDKVSPFNVPFSKPGLFAVGDELEVLCPLAGTILNVEISFFVTIPDGTIPNLGQLYYPVLFRLQKESGSLATNYISAPFFIRGTGRPAYRPSIAVGEGKMKVEKNSKLYVYHFSDASPVDYLLSYMSGYFSLVED